MDNDPIVILTFRTKTSVMNELDKIAKRQDRDRTYVINSIIRDAIYLKQAQVDPKGKAVKS